MNLKYFKESEFENCNPPCKMEDCNPRALECLDKLRDSCGFPLILTSAYRSHEWNVAHGRNYHSKHEEGIAFDIACTNSYRRSELVFKARFYGFNGIGIYKNFVHIDMRGNPVLWYGE